MIADQEINIKQLLLKLFEKKISIILITSIFSISSFLYVMNEENIYQISVKLFNKSDISNSASSLSAISGFLDVGTGSTNKTEYAISKLKSRDFFSHIIGLHKHYIKDIYAARKYNSSVNKFEYDDSKLELINNNAYFEKAFQFFQKKVINISRNRSSGIITISISHLSPNFAKELLDTIVLEINLIISKEDYLEASNSIKFLEESVKTTKDKDTRNSMINLIENNLEKQVISLVNNKNYIFRIVENPYVPEDKVYPARAKTIITFTIIGFIISLIFIIFKEIFFKRKQS